jgi:hypothetical protein
MRRIKFLKVLSLACALIFIASAVYAVQYEESVDPNDYADSRTLFGPDNYNPSTFPSTVQGNSTGGLYGSWAGSDFTISWFIEYAPGTDSWTYSYVLAGSMTPSGVILEFSNTGNKNADKNSIWALFINGISAVVGGSKDEFGTWNVNGGFDLSHPIYGHKLEVIEGSTTSVTIQFTTVRGPVWGHFHTAGAIDNVAYNIGLDTPSSTRSLDFIPRPGGNGNVPICLDNDSDGYVICDEICGPLTLLCGDCDNNDPSINPGAPEICGDRIDNDCDHKKDKKDPEGCCTPTDTPESVCNGIDDDCDGQIDEDYVPTPTTCGAGKCVSTGQTKCVDGVEGDTCTPGTPSAETCDNLDNDCDGAVDEDLTQPTTCGVGECMGNTGTETCAAGVWGNDTCDQYAGATAETCDGSLDENCDGVVDEGCNCTNGATRSCGSDTGECVSGTEICIGGVWSGVCVGEVGPSAEVCDNLDNDCDGSSDEDFTGLGMTCTVGAGVCEATGTYVCTVDGLGTACSATPGTPTGIPESICNGIDDDCNGQVDEDYVPTSITCGVGECASTGQTTCVGGIESDTCTPGTPSAETCDNLDNDCDGSFDEDFTDLGMTCTAGIGACESTGNYVCTADGLGTECSATPGTPGTEGPVGNPTCDDTIDNDCDGTTDEEDQDCACVTTGLLDNNCDGIDDDCDGTPDDEYVSTQTTCGVGECASTGRTTCVDGVEGDTCTPGTPSAETCDNLDNDCDGAVDEDLTQPTTCGVGECAGNTGVETCNAGVWGNDTCDPLAGATAETCDNLDNDCDRSFDEDFTDLGMTCTAGIGACEATGNYICSADGSGTECNATPGTPGVEGPYGNPTCGDTVDNDCDGIADSADIDCQDCTDADNDGYYVGGNECGIKDCDDNDASINPGAPEICGDRIDNDCDKRKDDRDPEGCISCFPTGTPEDICNGIDDDCDEEIDEDYVVIPTSCGVGICASTGQLECQNGQEVDTCMPGPQDEPTDVTCNGIDGDCDGLIDEDYTPTSTSCGAGECASTGQTTCGGGLEGDTCTPGTPSAELCDGLDNDCDGSFDEDFTDLGMTCKAGVGACETTGNYICSADGSGTECNATPGTPGTEGPYGDHTCGDTVDNDCDGTTDAGDQDCECVQTGLPDNNCDGRDDDCDGTPDDEYVTTPTTCGVGECTSTGQLECQGGSEVDTCIEGTPSTELCDGLDNDCDSSIDEDFTNLGTTCTAGIGVCEATGNYVCKVDGSGTECNAIAGIPGVEGPEGDITCSDNIDNDCDGQTDINDIDCGEECTPPPVRQEIGIQDILYNNLTESDCRFCHENPVQFPVLDVSIPDRHHLLEGNVIPDPTDAPFANPGELYECLSCHEVDTSTGEIVFIVERDCLVCHIQDPSELTVHHRTELAQGTLPQGPDCQACHGDIVDNRDDGHFIPTFDPMPETPKRNGGTGLPFNSRGDGAGACNYCHNDGICPPEVIPVETNKTTHHNTGFGNDNTKCNWCHDFTIPFEGQIRICENCHGRDSLHNIQADSDGDGVINPGIEQPFYGHIGNPDDCWGCHGYGPSASSIAPESGPVVPVISSISDSVLIEGTDTAVTLTGSAFTNMDAGIELSSDVVLIAPDGSSTTLIPDFISQGSITVTVPGSLGKGNYRVKAAKLDKYSNPKVISVKPSVGIVDIDCKKKSGQLEITGSGFGEKPDGADDYLNVEVNGQIVDVITWSDVVITVSVSDCKGQLSITVNALFGSAMWQ